MPKVKVSLTLDREILAAVDREARRTGRNRSQVIGESLRSRASERRRIALERQIEEYYAAQSASERREDAEWATLGDEAMRRW